MAQRDEMKLKTVGVDGKQYAEIWDGKPLYLEDDGTPVAFDAVGTRSTITRLNAEAISEHCQPASAVCRRKDQSDASRRRYRRSQRRRPGHLEVLEAIFDCAEQNIRTPRLA
jgi:hypothetical protein